MRVRSIESWREAHVLVRRWKKGGHFFFSLFRRLAALCPETTHVPCADESSCVPASQRCDGYRQCADGSDETDRCKCMKGGPRSPNFTQKTTLAYLLCLSYLTLPRRPCSRVNSVPNENLNLWVAWPRASNLSAPSNYCLALNSEGTSIFLINFSSTGPCFANEFTCCSSDCVSNVKRCNGVPNCRNGSDEKDCRKPTPLHSSLSSLAFPTQRAAAESIVSAPTSNA